MELRPTSVVDIEHLRKQLKRARAGIRSIHPSSAVRGRTAFQAAVLIRSGVNIGKRLCRLEIYNAAADHPIMGIANSKALSRRAAREVGVCEYDGVGT